MIFPALVFASSLVRLTPEPSVDCTQLTRWPMTHFVVATGQGQIAWDAEENISRTKFSTYVHREALFARKEQRHFRDLFIVSHDQNNAALAAELVNEIRAAGLKFGKNCPPPID